MEISLIEFNNISPFKIRSEESSLIQDDNISISSIYEDGKLFNPFPLEENTILKMIKTIPKPKEKRNISFKVYRFFNPKLTTIDIYTDKIPGKKKLFLSRKKNRKIMQDNIIKKIKSKFFKYIKIILKERLVKRYNYKGSFKFLPQKFICNIKKDDNKSIWNETLLEFLENKLQSNNKYKILGFLKDDKIGEIKLQDLYNEYLNSQEFEEIVHCIKKEKNVNEKYVNDYKINAKEFINYFTQEKKSSKKIY